jgi:FixJ family two-component response regulator
MNSGMLPVTTIAAVQVVYIVDDDDSVRMGLSRLMRSAGFDPREFASPETFLREVRTEACACILLDITMPGITGLEVQKRLGDKGINLPVIALSARDDDETRALARALGAHFFLSKPVDDRALLDAIDWVKGPNRRT